MVESSFLKFQHAGKAKPMDEAFQVVAEFIRVLKEQVEQMVKVKLNLENNICHWMVRWAATTCSKYMVGKKMGKHSFQRRTEKEMQLEPKRSLKSLTLTILWNSAKLVKTSPGIIVR